MSLASGASTAPIFGKQEVMKLILDWKTCDREQAKLIYKRENALHPEWQLKEAFEALKGKKNDQ